MTQKSPNPSLSLFPDYPTSEKARRVERASSQRRIDAIRQKYELLRAKRFAFQDGTLREDDHGSIKLSYKDVISAIAKECFCEASLVEKVVCGYYTY